MFVGVRATLKATIFTTAFCTLLLCIVSVFGSSESIAAPVATAPSAVQLAKTDTAQSTPSPAPEPRTLTPIPTALNVGLGIAGVAILFALIMAAIGVRSERGTSRGPILVAALPVFAAMGLLVIPFAPNLGDGRWIPVDVLGAALLFVGTLFGYIYGLPVADPDALSKAAASSGTFLRPSPKLDKVIDAILPALTGGVVTFALTQAGHFNALFLRLAHIPKDSPSELLGIAMLAYFPSIGFMLAYTLMNTVGAIAFKNAEEALVTQISIIQTFPPFPDLPTNPTAEQIVAAKDIAERPYNLLSGAQKADWARAQTLLGNYADAERAYLDAIAADPLNASLLVDYATTVYNDPAIDMPAHVLLMLDQAQAMLGSNASTNLKRRMNALRAATTLYCPGKYELVIELVNDWIRSSVPVTRLARYYRACAFGQLYESCATVPATAASPYATLPALDDARLRSQVHSDIALTLVSAGDIGRDNILMVIDPLSGLRTRPDDDDLQTLAADDPVLCASLNLVSAPPPSTAPHPPPPSGSVPNPLATPAGTLATWIDQYCPL